MKILFSPEYSGHVFIGLNEQHPELMDTMVCDTMGLVAMLELRLGIHVDDISGNNRTVLYYKAMSEYMECDALSNASSFKPSLQRMLGHNDFKTIEYLSTYAGSSF